MHHPAQLSLSLSLSLPAQIMCFDMCLGYAAAHAFTRVRHAGLSMSRECVCALACAVWRGRQPSD